MITITLRCVAILLALAGTARAAEPLVLETRIPLGEVSGRIDHMAIDLGRKRLLVAELGNGSLGIVGLAEGRVLGRIAGLPQPQGTAYVAASDMIYVADAADGSVRLFRAADLAPAGRLDLGDDADNIRIDQRTGQVAIGYGDGGLALIDIASGRPAETIKLPAHPESFQIAAQDERIFVNLPEAGHIGVVDRRVGREVAQWRVAGAAANFPMALAGAERRLFVVFRRPALLAAVDIESGRTVARLPTCGDADDVFFDARRRRLYVSCGEGALAVIRLNGDRLDEAARIRTAAGARTSLFVPELDRLFLAVRATRGAPAALWVFRPGD